jgi:hypothetical protein
MNKYRVCASLLIGVGFVSVLCLLLNVPGLNLILSALFVPGAIALDVLRLAESDSNTTLLAANVIIYSLVAFFVILLRFRSSPIEQSRRFTARMVLPVLAVLILACFPVLNPMLPVGMAELGRQERELQQALNPSVNVHEARSVLEKRGIDFGEHIQESDGLVFQDGLDKRITASTGDLVLVSRWRTSAASFPCGYDMEIVLLFGHDEKLKDRYIRRFPICP